MEFPSETGDIAATAGVSLHVVMYDPGKRDRHRLEALVGLLEHCTPQLKAKIAKTSEEFSVDAEKADHALLFLDSASAAVRSAIALGEAASKALSEWVSLAKEIEQLLLAFGDKAILLLKDGRQASDLANLIGVSPPVDGDFSTFRQTDRPDPIIDCIAEIAVRRATNLPSTIGGIDVLGLEALPEEDDRPDLCDLAASKYYQLHSRMGELDSERKSTINHVLHGQHLLEQSLNAFHSAIGKLDDGNSDIEDAFYEAMSLGGDQRRLKPLRLSMLHKPMAADIGPLTPQVIPTPFSRKHLSPSTTPAAHEAPASPHRVSQSPKST